MLLELFATWCPHCAAEAPHLKALVREAAAGRATRSSRSTPTARTPPSVLAYHIYFGLPFPALVDPNPSDPGSFQHEGSPGPGLEGLQGAALPDLLRDRPARADRLGGHRRAAGLAAAARAAPRALPGPRMPGFRERCRRTLGSFAPGEKVERPADKAVRRANLRRIGRLFRGYWGKLSVVTVLIVIASLLGVIPAFLLRDIISKAFKPCPGGHVTVDMHAAHRARRSG